MDAKENKDGKDAEAIEAEKPEPAPVNAAKLREALNTIVKWCDNELLDPKFERATIAQFAEVALSEPARNCDRFATLDAARKAFYSGYFGPTEAEYIQHALLLWLFDPAEGGKESGAAAAV